MKKERIGLKKLWVNVSASLYERIKEKSKQRSITFTKYVNRALLRYILDEEKYE